MCEKTPLEILDEARKEGEIPCFTLRYILTIIGYYIQTSCQKIIEHSFFETLSLLVIMANCVVLAMDDPTSSVQEEWQIEADYIFQALYTIEIAMKSFGMGFVLSEDAYLRDPWNIMDFTIVVFGYLSMFNLGGGVDLKALRTFRVLRPLRTISSVEGLKILISSLATSLPLLMDTIIILLFFFMVFAIAGLQLWHGILRKRCFNVETGRLDDTQLCGYASCDDGWTCVNGFGNPNYGATHFDDVFTALLTVFQCVTMEGWTDTQYVTTKVFGPYSVIFYTPLILIGSFFLVNFTLAVIKSQVTRTYEENRQQKLGAKGKKKKANSSPDELQQEAENKISLAQLLGLRQLGDPYRKHIVPFALHIHDKKDNGAYIAEFEFANVDKELQDSLSDEDPLSGIKPRIAPIHEDIIREEDENHLDGSSMDGADNSIHLAVLPKKPATTSIKPGLPIAPLGGARIVGKFSRASAKRRINVSSPKANQKTGMYGIAGLAKTLPQGVKAAFCGLEGLDEFSETFFAQQSEGFAGLTSVQDAPRKEKLSLAQNPYSEASSSFLDFEASQIPSASRDITPANISHNLDQTPLGLQEPPPLLIQHLPFQSSGLARKSTLPNKQNTTGTAVSSNSFSSVNAPNEISLIKNKLHMPKLSIPLKDDTSEAIIAPAPEEKIDKEAVKPEQEAEAEPENPDKGKGPEKFVLKEGDIAITSVFDVQPRKLFVSEKKVPEREVVKVLLFAPYKLKILYDPTQLPVEEEEETTMEGGSPSRSGKNPETGSASENASPLRRSTTMTLTKGGKGKKKGKSKKKGKKGKRSKSGGSRSGSKAASRRPSQTKVTDQQSATSGDRESRKAGTNTVNNNEGASVRGSVVSGRKDFDQLVKEKAAADAQVEGEETAEQQKGIKEKENRKKFFWSGQEVLVTSDPYYAVYATSYMNNARVWKYGWEGKMKWARSGVKRIMMSSLMENFMNLLVMVNTITLALDRYEQPQAESDALNVLNMIFTGIFASELMGKLFGLGLVGYLSDNMNYLDGSVVLFSLVEVVFLNGQGALSAFRTLRIFRVVRMIRTLRVLRVARLLRSLRSMQTIIEVIGKTISSFTYIGLLLLILIFIYALFGMQLFGGRFDFSDGKPRQNYDSFNNAFLTMFQVLTMENWQNVLYYCMRAQNSTLSSLYLITWIFIGNYILLNLFLAIMLDAFTEVDEEMDSGAEVFFKLFNNDNDNMFRRKMKTKMRREYKR